MSLPSLNILCQTQVDLVICGRPWADNLLSGLPKTYSFIPIHKQFFRDQKAVIRHRFLNEYPATQTYGLIFPNSFSSAAIFRFAGIRSAGYNSKGRSSLLSWDIARPNRALHNVQLKYLLTRTALERWKLLSNEKTSDAELTMRLPVTKYQRTLAHRALTQAGLSSQLFVLISPTATGLHKGKAKIWPGFDQITRRLQINGYKVVMCPTESEINMARDIAPTAYILPSLSLGAYAALASRSTLVICNDSGVSHVAAAVGASQITLFGVTQPHITRPWSSQAIVLGSEKGWPSIQEVEDAVLKLLDAYKQKKWGSKW